MFAALCSSCGEQDRFVLYYFGEIAIAMHQPMFWCSSMSLSYGQSVRIELQSQHKMHQPSAGRSASGSSARCTGSSLETVEGLSHHNTATSYQVYATSRSKDVTCSPVSLLIAPCLCACAATSFSSCKTHWISQQLSCMSHLTDLLVKPRPFLLRRLCFC